LVDTVLYTADDLTSEIERHKSSNWETLDGQLRAFAYEYVIHYDHRKAAKAVGFSESKGIKLIRDPLVSALIKDIQDRNLVSNIITEDFVRSQWLNLLPKLMGDEEVNLVTAMGAQFQAKKFHSSETVSVLKELSKSTKFYENGSGQEGGTTVNINLGAVCSDKAKVIDGEVVIDATKD
jgi:hypothetical protein